MTDLADDSVPRVGRGQTHAMTSATGLPAADPWHGAASGRFIALIAALGFALLNLLYIPAISAQPAGDDFGVPLSEITVGNREGLAVLAGQTRQAKNYRPGNSVMMWLAGRAAGITDPAAPIVGPDAPAALWRWIHVMRMACAGVLLAAAALVLRQMPVGRTGVITAIAAIVLHPSLAAAAGSVDGYSSLLAPAFVWLGAWAVIALRSRPAAGLVAATLCLLAGVFVKEYAFALVATAPLAALLFVEGDHRRRWTWALVYGLVLGGVTLLWLLARRWTVPEGVDVVTPSPSVMTIAFNAALIVLGGLFVGDSVWVYLTRSPVALATTAVVIVSTTALLAHGLWLRLRAHGGDAKTPGGAEEGQTGDKPAAWTWVVFLLLCALAINFPANVVMRMSEMYLAAWIVALGLLAGLAADGFARLATRDEPARPAGRRTVLAAAVLAAALAVVAAVSTWRKASAIAESGRYAAGHLASILRHVPPDARHQLVLLVYRTDQPGLRPTYSVYQVGDTAAVNSPFLLEMARPGSGLEVEGMLVEGDEPVRQIARSAGDRTRVLLWDAGRGEYLRVE